MIDANEALLNSYAGSRGRGGVNNKSYFVFLSLNNINQRLSRVQEAVFGQLLFNYFNIYF